MSAPRTAAQRELWLGFAVLGVLAVVAYLSTVALNGGPLKTGREVQLALPPDGPVLRPGAEVRIGGERAGDVARVALDGRGRAALATLRVSDGHVGQGAVARVRLRGMAGAVYVDLQPGDAERPLADGAVLRARPAVQLTDVVAAFDADTRRAMATSLRGLGVGLEGRGQTLQHTIAVAPTVLKSSTAVLNASQSVPGRLHQLLGALQDVSAAAAPARGAADRTGSAVPRAGELAATVAGARRTFGATARAAGPLGAALDLAPALERMVAGVLPVADRLLVHAAHAARTLQPAVLALDHSLPALRRVAARRVELGALETIGRRALPALRAAAPLVRAVRGPAAGLAATTPAIGTLAAYLVPYRTELVEAPAGFDRWGGFRYAAGAGAGHRAVRFSMVFTCARARNAYPAPGAAHRDREACR